MLTRKQIQHMPIDHLQGLLSEDDYELTLSFWARCLIKDELLKRNLLQHD